MALSVTAQGRVCGSYLKQPFTTTDDDKQDRNTVPSPGLSASPHFKFGLPIFEPPTQVKQPHKLQCTSSSLLTKNHVNNLVYKSQPTILELVS